MTYGFKMEALLDRREVLKPFGPLDKYEIT